MDAVNSWTALTPALGVALFAGYVEEVLSRGVILRILDFVYVLFGLPPPIADGLLESRLSGPHLLIGDTSGVESSILALTLCVAAAVVLLVAAHRRSHFVRPFWARTTEATNNETMGEETNP